MASIEFLFVHLSSSCTSSRGSIKLNKCYIIEDCRSAVPCIVLWMMVPLPASQLNKTSPVEKGLPLEQILQLKVYMIFQTATDVLIAKRQVFIPWRQAS